MNQNAATMSDEELDAAIADQTGLPIQQPPVAPVTAEVPAPAPTVEEPTPVEEQPAAPVEGEEQVVEETPPASRREQLRVQQLLAKMREGQPTVTPPSAPTPTQGSIDYDKDIEADPETLQRIKEDRERARQEAYQQGMTQTKSIQFHTRLEIDAPQIETKYPQLDKNSEKFHPSLANAVNTMYLSAVGYDPKTDTVQTPDLRYKDYVESIFELADEIANNKVQATQQAVRQQAANTGLRPGNQTQPKLNLNKRPEDMTDEELDAIIAQAIPPQKR